jgi:hypothetical protein
VYTEVRENKIRGGIPKENWIKKKRNDRKKGMKIRNVHKETIIRVQKKERRKKEAEGEIVGN